jgi:hypothetical protein
VYLPLVPFLHTSLDNPHFFFFHLSYFTYLNNLIVITGYPFCVGEQRTSMAEQVFVQPHSHGWARNSPSQPPITFYFLSISDYSAPNYMGISVHWIYFSLSSLLHICLRLRLVTPLFYFNLYLCSVYYL